jgi:hypothetical protein
MQDQRGKTAPEDAPYTISILHDLNPTRSILHAQSYTISILHDLNPTRSQSYTLNPTRSQRKDFCKQQVREE